MDGGGGGQPSTMTQTSIPEYADPYVKAMLGQAMKNVFDMRPVGKAEGGVIKLATGGNLAGTTQKVPGGTVTYPKDFGSPGVQYGQFTPGEPPMPSADVASGAPNATVDGFEIRGLRPPPIYAGVGAADQRVAGFSDPQLEAYKRVKEYKQPFMGEAEKMVPQYNLARSGLQGVYERSMNADPYNQGRFSPGYMLGDFNQQSFNREGTAQEFMSPYMQNVVDINKREALRDAGIQAIQQQGQASQAGAFGGGRDAIMRAEMQRNLGTRLSDIQNTGTQAAFQNAQQQFNTEAARNFAAQQAREQAKQFGSGVSLQAQGMGEQSRQFGAGLENQRLQQQTTAAMGYGQLADAETARRLQYGQQEFGQRMGVNDALLRMGGMDQQRRQQQINNAYADFVNQQNYPYKQLGFMSDMLRGLPLSNVATFQAAPSPLSQVAGLATAGLGGLSLYNAMQGAHNG